MLNMDELSSGLDDCSDLLAMAVEEGDSDTVDSIATDVDAFEARVAELEFRRMFSGEMDANNAFVDIQAGSGGTEAQDWGRCCCECICAGANSTASKPN